MNDDRATHDAASPVSDEVFSANQRSAQYLASRDGVGEFSKFVADGIETDGEKAIAETVDLYRQTAERSQDQADALINKVMPDLSPENAKRLYDQTINGINPDAQDALDRALGRPTAKPPVKEDKLLRPEDIANAPPPRAEPYYPPAPGEEDPDAKMMLSAGTDNGDGSHQLGAEEPKNLDVRFLEHDGEGLTVHGEQDGQTIDDDIDSEPFRPMPEGGADHVQPGNIKSPTDHTEGVGKNEELPNSEIKWEDRSSDRVFDGENIMDVDGPIKIDPGSVTPFDGKGYEVEWFALDKNSNVIPQWRSSDYKPQKGGGHNIPGLNNSKVHYPPYPSEHGYRVIIRVPPQSSSHGNSTGVHFDIYSPKGSKLRKHRE